MKTLFDKIWDKHIVDTMPDGTVQLYIDRLYCHEVTSPQAFEGLRRRGLKPMHPERIICVADHNIPTINQDQPIADPVSRLQVATLEKNCREFGLTYYGLQHPRNGIVHVVGPEYGFTLPGMTIVCGDSHTSTHGALGAIAFGIGTSEVEMTLATQCLLQRKPKTMRITVDGRMRRDVTAKDLSLYLISKMGAGGATGFFVEYAGETIRNCTMEERLTICNMSIEMGARGGMIAPDEKTIEYIHGTDFAPRWDAWKKSKAEWARLCSDPDATFDAEFSFRAEAVEPMVTFGTNPGMAMGIRERIPVPESAEDNERSSWLKALEYMGFEPWEPILGKPIDYVFLGSCTNGRVEDFAAFASIVKGKKKAESVTAWLVPGSHTVLRQIRAKNIDKILEEAGFEIRQPGCSACLAMNDDKVPPGKYVVSTSNRNFEGRQGPGARTILASPIVAAAAAITGKISDPREIYTHEA
ncbi:MAG: 3-isopropylmalate dehydratase large subunit [Tannerellaceae bacterium]|jgi:3-isopropylmalate/(R)-2-methylmalate dehydratase large subunit|nr:3-isopropylmalate dehydratase large subunit [Tannerellaceae bacterium]